MTVRSSDFSDGALVARTLYTAGTGTHTWNARATRFKATLVGAGGGGARPQAGGTPGGSAGSAGGTIEWEGPIIGANAAYEVGAGGAGSTTNGTSGTNGGRTRLGPLIAPGGYGGSWDGSNTPGGGAAITAFISSSTGRDSVMAVEGLTAGGYGGGSSPNVAGHGGGVPGAWFPGPPSLAAGGADLAGSAAGGGGGGGSTPYGVGGAGGASGDGGTAVAGANGTGYGAGGGGGGSGNVISGNGGNGTGGYLLIEEYL